MRRKWLACLFVLVTVGFLVSLAFPRSRAAAVTGINPQLSFEGKIISASGVNIADGTYNMEFKIYQDGTNTGSGSTLKWTEDRLVGGTPVTITAGTFQVNLGSVTAFGASVDWNQSVLWLSMQIGNTSTCTISTTFTSNCAGDGEMTPYIRLTATPYALNSDKLGGLNASAFGQLASNQTWTGTNIFQPTSNISAVAVRQTSAGLPSADIFDVQGTNGTTNFLQVTSTAANQGAVTIQSVGGSNAVALTSAGALSLTGAAASTWDIGANNLSLQTTGNGAITTGTGLLTQGGSVTFSGSTARTITGPGAGGLTINVPAGPLTLSTTTSGTLAVTSAGALSLTTTTTGALTITAAAASTWSTSVGALTIQSASGSNFSAAALGAGITLLGTAGTGTTQLGNTTGVTNLIGPNYTTTSKGVCVTATAATCGATNASIVLLDLNQSTLQGAETAGNCSTTINAGGLYYSAATVSGNTTTQELRGCINGAWKDVVTADQLGIILLGVVPDTGSNPGDIGGITGVANGPCKVSWASTTSVSVAPCTAYSNGRKVVITAATTIASLSGVSSFYHICLNGTNNAPVATVANASETAGLPAFSTTAPVLCIATVLTGAGSTISNIWDTRTFTNDEKEFITTTAAMSPGWIAVQTAANQVTTTTTASAANVMGVIAVGSTTGSTTIVNGILVSHGPAYVSATTATSATFTAGNTGQTSTTAGYATLAATAGAYKDLGLVISPPVNTACTAATNCQYSIYLNVAPH